MTPAIKDIKAMQHSNGTKYASLTVLFSVNAILLTLIMGLWVYVEKKTSSMDQRSTVSESAAALLQRMVDKNTGKAEGTLITFSQLDTVVRRICDDATYMKIAIAKLQEASAHNLGSTNRPDLNK